MGVKSPNLTTECACPVTFSVLEGERSYDVETIKGRDGRRVSVLLRTAKIRTWTLHFKNRTKTEMAALRTFWDARQGSFGRFYWDNTETSEVDIPVHFDGKSWDASWDTAAVCNASLKIEEVVE